MRGRSLPLVGRSSIYIIKGVMSVCLGMLPMAGRTAGPIKTKLGIGTHVDPWSVFSQGQGQDYLQAGPRQYRSSAKRDKFGGQTLADRGLQVPRE